MVLMAARPRGGGRRGRCRTSGRLGDGQSPPPGHGHRPTGALDTTVLTGGSGHWNATVAYRAGTGSEIREPRHQDPKAECLPDHPALQALAMVIELTEACGHGAALCRPAWPTSRCPTFNSKASTGSRYLWQLLDRHPRCGCSIRTLAHSRARRGRSVSASSRLGSCRRHHPRTVVRPSSRVTAPRGARCRSTGRGSSLTGCEGYLFVFPLLMGRPHNCPGGLGITGARARQGPFTVRCPQPARRPRLDDTQ